MRRAILLIGLLVTASPCPAAPQFAPLVHVRWVGPEGMRVAFFQGSARIDGNEFPAPVAAGLRPGYAYRTRLTGFPNHPGLMLFPTVEIKGALCLPPHLSTSRYPVPIPITEQDVEHIVSGRFITKVIYLEDPEKAVAVATRSDQPLEIELPPERDLMFEANQLGRPMLVVRIGTRIVPDKELAEQSVAGTVLLPGKGMIDPPAAPPCFPWAGVRLFDPILGERPKKEECLVDGGDQGWPAGIDGSGRLRGVEPTDTVAEFRDSTGRLKVAVSNRVCICVPRFAVLRTEMPLQGYEVAVGLAGAQLIKERHQLGMNIPPLEAEQRKRPFDVEGRLRPSVNLALQGPAPLLKLCVLQAVDVPLGPAVILDLTGTDTAIQIQRVQLMKQMQFARELSVQAKTAQVDTMMGPAVLGRVKGLDVIAATIETRDLTICCNECPRPPDKPLVLWKWADRTAAQVGDVVTFTLKYSNHGGRPITDVALVDSLTGRLEYVDGSAKSSRESVFTMQTNEAGSMSLRWEVSGEVLPGQGGVVSFQARVR